MTFRPLAMAVLAISILAPSFAQSAWVNRVRNDWQSVQGTPIVHRSNRLGHVYGNNVRRVQQRKVMVNAGAVDQPLRSYFYVD